MTPEEIVEKMKNELEQSLCNETKARMAEGGEVGTFHHSACGQYSVRRFDLAQIQENSDCAEAHGFCEASPSTKKKSSK